MTSIDTTNLMKFAELKRLVKDKEGDVKALKKELAALEQVVLAEFIEAGEIDSLRVHDGKRKVTVYVTSQIWPENLISPDATAVAMKAAGLGHMVNERANTNTLAAYLRDLDKAEEPLPPELEGVVGVFVKNGIGVRAS